MADMMEQVDPIPMPAKTLMIQGTSSSVGKSVLVAALCRIFRQDGRRVAPFKAQNMALNSYVTADGGEMGRAQVVQAEAAGIAPTVDMNPVLLKPQAGGGSQLIVHGKVEGSYSAQEYYRRTPALLKAVTDSLRRLGNVYDIIVIEGAGNPAEINLKEREIVNMRVAHLAAAPVLLAGDIDRGGVFAAFVGTLELLNPEERDYIRGFIVNKFRGDRKLLEPGLRMLEERTARPVLGVVPYFRDIRIAQEDSVYLDERRENSGGDLAVAIIRLPHISNYDDFDPLEEAGAVVRYVSRPDELGEPHLIILPGTKSTVSDLGFLAASGLAEAILQRAKKGIPVIGICGGYQMLGRTIADPSGVESASGEIPGLGLLPVSTVFAPEKATRQVRGRVCAGRGLLAGLEGTTVSGYEIHLGESNGDVDDPLFRITDSPSAAVGYGDGAASADGLVCGSYLHGLFHNPVFLGGLLGNVRRHFHMPEREGEAVSPERQYDRLAELVRNSLDMVQIYRLLERGL